MALQIRRGLSSQMTSGVTPAVGEPIFTTDTEKLYVGDGNTTADLLVPVNPDTNTTDLADVDNLTASDGQFLLYDTTSSSYIPTDATVDNLIDTNITSLADGETLTYDSASSKWVNSAGSGGGTINGLSDTNITSLASGEMLVYNGSTGKWVNDAYARGLSTVQFAYIGNSVQIEAVGSDVSLSFTDNTFAGYAAGISDNAFSTGTAKHVLTANGSGGLNWEQVLLENAASGTLTNAANDSAAATAGVSIGGIYRNGSVLQVRVT